MRLILGTAGHIDHGKTALVRALTGVDTDRLPEEKRRGITIELGFAALALDGIDLGIIDVPGHEALVRTMLAGATGMDMVMLVIAADEGVMPQTREHLAIMELLEVRGAVVAITKADLVDGGWLDLVTTDVAETLQDTRFSGARIVPVSSRTGAGLDVLRGELARLAALIDARTSEDVFRMPVDRVFTRHGTGTVVTGTVWSGRVRRDSALAIWPDGAPARARGLQVHGVTRDSAIAGERVAIALAVDREAIRRGDTLATDEGWRASALITARLSILPDSERPVRHRQRIRFHLGTAEILARVALLENDVLEPGETGWVQLRLETPCVARAGDRFVIRAYSPVRTIGGGAVAEPSPPRRKRLSADDRSMLRSVLDDPPDAVIPALITAAGSAGLPVREMSVLSGRPPVDVQRALDLTPPLRIGDRLFDPALGRIATDLVLGAVDAHHAAAPLDAGLPREALRSGSVAVGAPVMGWAVDALIRSAELSSVDGALARTGFQPSLDRDSQVTADALAADIVRAGLEAPDTTELGGPVRLPLLRFMEAAGRVTLLPGERWVDTAVLEALVERLCTRFGPGQELSTAELKESIGVTRKYLIPLLEHFDRSGITRRTAENRVWVGRPKGTSGTSHTTAVPAL